MARLEAEVSANINPFERGLKEATEKAREFAKKAGEITNDIGKEAGAGGITKMLGLAGGAAAATAFGAAIVEAVKSGIEAYSDLEQAGLHMGTALKDMDLGKEFAEWTEQLGGTIGQAKEFQQAGMSLIQSGMTEDQAKEQLTTWRNIAAGTGMNVAERAEQYRMAAIGEGGEKEQGLSRYIRGSGSVEQMLKEQQAATVEQLQQQFNSIPRIAAAGPSIEAAKAELDKVKNMSSLEYAKNYLGPDPLAAIRDMEKASTGPGGQYEKSFAEYQGTNKGHEDEFNAAMLALRNKIGEIISPEFKTFLDQMTAELPKLTPMIVALEKGVLQLTLATVKAAEAMFGAVSKTGGNFGDWTYRTVYDMMNGANAYEDLINNPSGTTNPNVPQDPQKILDEAKATNAWLNKLVEGLIGGSG